MTVYRDDLERGYRVNRCAICKQPTVFKLCRFCREPELSLTAEPVSGEGTRQ